MDPHELLKAAPELQKIVTTIVAGVPFAEIVKRIVVPSADALGERMRDRVERCFQKTGKMVQDAGFSPQPVPDKLSIEILRGASLEQDESLHTMWASLLANAASPDGVGTVRPSFIAIVKHMSPDEAAIVNWIYDHTDARDRLHGIAPSRLSQAREDLGFHDHRNPEHRLSSAQRFASCLDGLEAEQLIRRVYLEQSASKTNPKIEVPFVQFSYSVTRRGEEFMTVCRPPKANS